MFCSLSLAKVGHAQSNCPSLQTHALDQLQLNIQMKHLRGSNPYSKKIREKKKFYEQFPMYYLVFSENGFNFITQKITKAWKLSFFSYQNI